MTNWVIRIVSITSLSALLVLVLYLPSAHPPSSFIAQIRAEHTAAIDAMGPEHALRIMARMLDMQTARAQVSAEPAALAPAAASRAASDVNTAVAAQMGQVGQRLFNSGYVRSVDALFALALYRLSVWMESLPAVLVFGLLALADGLFVRVLRSRVFVQHSPEMFALHASLVIVMACLSVVALVLPVFVHPYWLAAAPFVMGLCLNRAVANYHRRS